MLELLLKCTDEKNISLAVRGYKIFFSSTALTLNCKPMAGLNKNRKPVAGLTTKNCQLISGRGTVYQPTDIKHLDNKLFIKKLDKQLFIDKKIAYSELNKLVREINQKLWQGDNEKVQNLYYTEMLLFSIADKEVFMDITKRWSELTKAN